MNYCSYFLLLLSISSIPCAFGTVVPPQTSVPAQKGSYQKARAGSLETQKSQSDAATQERLEKRAQGRKIQEAITPVIDATGEINEFLFHLPLIIRQQHPTTAVAVLNQLVRGVSIGIRAIGRWKEATQAILDTNEQILEAAIKSYEKIEAQTKMLEDLLGQKTIVDALKDIPSSNVSKSKKVLNLLNP